LRRRRQSGFTLIELIISITLVALLATSLLMAMRSGFLTFEKTTARLDLNRRVMSVEQILGRELSGAIPEMGLCATSSGNAARWPMFVGEPESLRLISSYSMEQGARGRPSILVFQVIRAPQGGVRLVVNESPWTGPASTIPFCLDGRLVAPPVNEKSFVLADKLMTCRFTYLERTENSNDLKVQPVWNRPDLPSGVHVQMIPLVPDSSRLPLMSVTATIRINKQVQGTYVDQ